MKSWKANAVFQAYLAELLDTAGGIGLVRDARSSIYAHLNHESLSSDADSRKLINDALGNIPKIQISLVASALFICAHAGFEQYVRDLIKAAANTISESNLVPNRLESSAQKILTGLYGHQVQLAGEAFRRYFEPLDHLRVDYATIANAVVQSSQEDKPFLLDGTVLGFRVGNISRPGIDSIFRLFNCTIAWNRFAGNTALQKTLKTSGIRETDKAVTEFLDRAIEKRNRIAHTQGSLDVSKEELVQQVEFLRELSSFLQQTLSDCIAALLPKKQKLKNTQPDA